MNGSKNGGNENGTDLGEGIVRIGVCGDGDCVGRVVVDIFGCLSKANVVEGAVYTVLWRNDIEELSDDKLLGDTV